MALKDWKQVYPWLFVKKDESQALSMVQKGFEEKYTFDVSQKQSNGHYLLKNRIYGYTSKVEAIKLAKKYMETH